MENIRLDQLTSKASIVKADGVIIADSADLDADSLGKEKKISISDLKVIGGSSLSSSSSYTILDDDGYDVVYFTQAATATLPTVSANTEREILIMNLSTGTVTLDGEGSETINGSATHALSSQYDRAKVRSNGAEWFLISE